ncbi:hypothetical protein RN001_006959 [Aquatica leii]|uniref:Ubiquitin-conjugating enzyme E2 Z n=1 Tax=Aquatica leii TaxID=1421715 RepID=A0AAN7Q984_9COLE|nr:hypothetical protein RN001_006959 [Aquatica leii]
MPRSGWDPTEDSEQGTLTATASSRIKRDLMTIFTDPPPGLFVVGDELNLKIIHAIIVGVMDTPYEGGFFYFVLKCPNDYPIRPPKVKLMTTDAGNVRFNPNIYSSGKVCLSILGTWNGPAWSPAQQLSSLLLSIQSLLNEKPYFNEPGLVQEQIPGDSKRYNEFIQHETLRVSVCGMMENQCRLSIPEQLKDIMGKTFLEFYDQYVEIAKNNMHLDGTEMIDPFNKGRHLCHYKNLLLRLEKIRAKVMGKTWNFFKEPSCTNVDLKERQTNEEAKCSSTIAS